MCTMPKRSRRCAASGTPPWIVLTTAVRLLVDGYYPAKEIRTVQVSEATPLVAAVPKVREWMKETQRQCLQFGSLVMEGRDIGTHVFPGGAIQVLPRRQP